MKAQLTVIFAVLSILCFFQRAHAGIAGSKHDFSNALWSGGQVCLPCHTPHDAETDVTNAPLWNHELTEVINYTLYTSETLDSQPGQPDGISKLCLSCHDGTVAIDSFGGTEGSEMINSGRLIGTDLRGTHPISLIYDTALATADSGLNDPSGTGSGLGGTIEQDLLFDNKLECASCHDIHGTAGNARLLRVSNQGSALCLTCHNK